MWWNCKKTALLVALFCVVQSRAVLPAGSLRTDSVRDSMKIARYEKRAERFMSFWHSLTARRVVAQYAGGIGLFSAGLGWMYGKNNSWETDFLLGYVPPYTTGRGKLTITARETYVPFDIKVYGDVNFQPLAVAMYFNVITGHEFWMSEPVRYPHKYYGFSSGMRAGISVGQRLRLHIPEAKRRIFREVIIYYDFNTCDFDIASFSTNRYVSLWDIINISLGLKWTVF